MTRPDVVVGGLRTGGRCALDVGGDFGSRTRLSCFLCAAIPEVEFHHFGHGPIIFEVLHNRVFVHGLWGHINNQ